MKVIAINGSSRKDGNTFQSFKIIEEVFNKYDIELEIIHVGAYKLSGCMGCGHCVKHSKCIIDDEVNEVVEKIRNADGLLLGSPVYYSGVSGVMKTFLDRAFYVLGQDLRFKPTSSVVTVRRTGGSNTLDELNHYLNYCQSFIVSSSYWNVIHGANKTEVLKDDEGVQTLMTLAENFSYLLRVLSESKVELPNKIEKVWTNFIR